MAETGERCKAEVWRDGAYRSTRCIKKATRDGYCGTHHPDAEAKRKAKRDERDAAREAGWARIRQRSALAQRMQQLTSLISIREGDALPDDVHLWRLEAQSIMRALAELEGRSGG